MRLGWSLVVLVLFGLPAAGAQTPVSGCERECHPQAPDVNGLEIHRAPPVKVILYGHFETLLGRVPLSTQPLELGIDPDVNGGFLMPLVTTRTGTQADLNFQTNEFLFYATPWPHHGDTGPRMYYQPGLARDLYLDGTSVTGYFYLSPDHVRTGGIEAPALLGGVYVEMLVEPARGEGLYAYGTGERGVLVRVPGVGAPVYEFAVPLRLATNAWPADPQLGGFHWRVRVFQLDSPAAQFSQADWRVRSGPQFPPRLVLGALNPLEVTPVEVIEWENDTLARVSVVSPFGPYDVDEAATALDVTGPLDLPATSIELVRSQRGLDHDAGQRPIWYIWKLDFDDAPPGSYRLEARFQNAAGTFGATSMTEYRVHHLRGSTDVPGFEVALVALALFGLFASLRRR